MSEKILVTGSAGHLGEALLRYFRANGVESTGIDIKPSDYTDHVGSIIDQRFAHDCIVGCDTVIHTATLHKPHVGTHTRQDFIDTNISGTMNLLEAAATNNCKAFVYTSTTSTFGDAMHTKTGDPAIWVTEELRHKPKNIYGVTKTAAEDLCNLFNRNTGMPCIVLKTSRFFPEEDDAKKQRDQFNDTNLKVNELLFRRVDIADIVTAHQLAIARAADIGFDRFIISGSTPFQPTDAHELGTNAPAVLKRYFPQYVAEYERRNWQMFQTLDRVYDNTRAREILGWKPQFTFERAIDALGNDCDYRSAITLKIGKKGYHSEVFEDGPYPIGSF